jgi:inner membrane protein
VRQEGAGERRARRGAWAETALLVVAANFADVDLVLGLVSTEAYLLWHRGLTHSLAGLAVFPPALAALAHGLAPRLSFRRALLLCEIGFLSHVALDLPTSWGTLLLYPWSHDRLALDWVFIVDPFVWAILAGGILRGVRRGERSRRRSAAWALAVAGLYVAAAGAIHGCAEGRARDVLDDAGHSGVTGVEVFPLPFSPLRWHGAAWTGDSLVHVFLDGLPPRVERLESEPHGLSGDRARAALFTPAGQAFLWWARVPAARVLESSEGGAVVGFGDRRFYLRGREVFEMEVRLGPSGEFSGATWEGDSVFMEAR